ncbi:hypothetical protein RUND412_005101 [Rhizina undulata]
MPSCPLSDYFSALENGRKHALAKLFSDIKLRPKTGTEKKKERVSISYPINVKTSVWNDSKSHIDALPLPPVGSAEYNTIREQSRRAVFSAIEMSAAVTEKMDDRKVDFLGNINVSYNRDDWPAEFVDGGSDVTASKSATVTTSISPNLLPSLPQKPMEEEENWISTKEATTVPRINLYPRPPQDSFQCPWFKVTPPTGIILRNASENPPQYSAWQQSYSLAVEDLYKGDKLLVGSQVWFMLRRGWQDVDKQVYSLDMVTLDTLEEKTFTARAGAKFFTSEIRYTSFVVTNMALDPAKDLINFFCYPIDVGSCDTGEQILQAKLSSGSSTFLSSGLLELIEDFESERQSTSGSGILGPLRLHVAIKHDAVNEYHVLGWDTVQGCRLRKAVGLEYDDESENFWKRKAKLRWCCKFGYPIWLVSEKQLRIIAINGLSKCPHCEEMDYFS